MTRTSNRIGQQTSQGGSGGYFKETFLGGSFMGAVVAALISGAITYFIGVYTGPHTGLVRVKVIEPTVTATKTVTGHPVTKKSTSTPSSTPSVQAGPTPTPSIVPLLSPKTDVPGWTLAWHDDVTIGPSGITFGARRPQQGDGETYDIHYVPGTGEEDGFQFGNGETVDFMGFWKGSSPPDPGTMSGLPGNIGDCNPCGVQVYAGDRDYLTLESNIIVYMQVLSVEPSDVVADAWAWTKS